MWWALGCRAIPIYIKYTYALCWRRCTGWFIRPATPLFLINNTHHSCCWKWLHEKGRADQQALGFSPEYWVVHNKVYDLQSYISKHPGGRLWLELTQGQDITELYETHHLNERRVQVCVTDMWCVRVIYYDVRRERPPYLYPYTGGPWPVLCLWCSKRKSALHFLIWIQRFVQNI